MAEVKSLLAEKLDDTYNRNHYLDNFAEEKELTVTITLAEYRKLISDVATSDARIKAAEDGKWSRENENQNLKKDNESLKAEIKDLKYKLMDYERPARESEEE